MPFIETSALQPFQLLPKKNADNAFLTLDEVPKSFMVSTALSVCAEMCKTPALTSRSIIFMPEHSNTPYFNIIEEKKKSLLFCGKKSLLLMRMH